MVMRFRLSSVNFRKIFVKLAKAFTVQCDTTQCSRSFSANFLEQNNVFKEDKEFTPHRPFFVHQYGRPFIVLYTNMVAVTSCENDPIRIVTQCPLTWRMNCREEFEMRSTYFTQQDPLLLVWTLIILDLNIYYSFLTQYCFFKHFLWQLA